MGVTIRSGDFEILASGMLLSFDEKPITFDLTHNSETITLSMQFTDDSSSKPASVFLKVKDPAHLDIVVRNLRIADPYQINFSRPHKVGDIGGRELWVDLQASRLIEKETTRYKVRYTFYLGAHSVPTPRTSRRGDE